MSRFVFRGNFPGSVSVPFRGISFPNELVGKEERDAEKCVSVPFRGISFPNSDRITEGRSTGEFPSPSGASHFQIDWCRWFSFSGRPFPSPSGASHFQIRRWTSSEVLSSMFPSPSGASHFQMVIVGKTIAQKFLSFRPLPGHLISKSYPSHPAFHAVSQSVLRGKTKSEHLSCPPPLQNPRKPSI